MMFFDRVKIWLPNLDEHLVQMENCEQDKDFHSEGNVLIHTEMVLNEVEKLDLPENEKDILRWTALLHDIGKPYCSTIEDGHIRSHGHSRKGYHIANGLLEHTHLDKLDKLQILNIIRVHGEPNWIMEKKDPKREVIKMSMMCRLDLLYHFVRCDVLGRKTSELESKNFLDNLEYFKEIAIELNCFTKPYNFTTNIAKFNYLVKQTHHFTDEPYNDTKSKVFMMCGLPGSGKDYFIKNTLSWLPVISLDEIRKELGIKPTDVQGKVIQTAKERAREFMRKGEDFVWNATNTTKRMRTELISFFTEYNSYVSIFFINKSLKTLLEQNKNRNNVVPENVIVKLYNKLDIPTDGESHELRIIS